MFLLGVDTSISYNLNRIFQISVKFGLLKDQATPNKQQVRKCSLTFECDRTKENPNTLFTIRVWLPEDFETKNSNI